MIEDSELGERNEARFGTRVALDLRAEYRRPLAVGSLALTFELMNAVNIGNTCCYKLIAEDDGGDVTFTYRVPATGCRSSRRSAPCGSSDD